MAAKLVDIVNLPPSEPCPEMLEVNPGAGQMAVEGKKGQILGFIGEDGRHLVQTFDGELVRVGDENLREYEPPSSQERGGFDLAFPGSESGWDFFQLQLEAMLLEKDYCVVQMSLALADRMAACRTVSMLDRWSRIIPEFETAYMGRSPSGKKVMWTSVLDEEFGDQLDHGLDVPNELLKDMGLAVSSVCQNLGFEGNSQTNGMVHANCDGPDDEEELLEDVSAESGATTAREIQEHISFAQRRRICMVLFVSGSGGTLTLHPKGREGQEVTVSCVENQLVVFRNDLCDYTYKPDGKQLAIQAWVLREPHAGEVLLDAPVDSALLEQYDQVPPAPRYGNSSERVDIMALACNNGGSADNAACYWSVLATGTDAIALVPLSRWDWELYYTTDTTGGTPGRGYTRHFGMLAEDQVISFDNDFFGLSPAEAMKMDPPSRKLMEVGYDCLYRGGWTRKTLESARVATCWGYAGSDFVSHELTGRFGASTENSYRNNQVGACANRLHYIFGMTGPAFTCETACSSGLTATCVMHNHMRPPVVGETLNVSMNHQCKYGMAGAANGHYDPFYTMGLCGAHMLSLTGRCYTFDASGDGFIRAEGIGAMYYKVSEGEDLASLAMLTSTRMNQDGRSASLTAPNGPSQQECIRFSLREAAIDTQDIHIQELHGTGTALGDPIEVGALRATMMTCGDGEVREHPLVKSSSKSNLGHGELNAGLAGIMKCVLMGVYCVAAPNNHIRLLNPHIDTAAYPVYFCTEFVEQGSSTGFHGVSSFGFSGCNARGDIWTRAQSGMRNTQPRYDRGTIDLTSTRLHWCNALFGKLSLPRPAKPLVDAGLENLEDYDGAYLTGAPCGPDDKLYCRGSFNAWSSMEPMVWKADLNAYWFAFPLGEACVEQFQICLNKNKFYTIFPVSKMAGSDARIVGPGEAPPGHNWVVDGRAEGATPGTPYAVLFGYDEAERQKYIYWGPSSEIEAADNAAELAFPHRYAVIGSWTTWRPVEMRPGKEPGLFSTSVRIGGSGEEEFRILRDRDPMQAIYPARATASPSFGVPVCGPDHRGEGRHWAIRGETGKALTISLQVQDGRMSVVIASREQGEQTWTDRQSAAQQRYFITAAWNKWRFTPMVPDPSGNADLHTATVTLPRHLSAWNVEEAAFHIIAEEDPGRAIHPEMPLADQLLSRASGPDAKGEGLHWAIRAEPGATVQITLDLSQDDLRRVVTWDATEDSLQSLSDR